ncbi:MAG TPA: T9SS type A sorting domain-containing protein, partial [Bacteroidales bacterium]|nr:T9SS type A sorting domain-containing protein [Bacteroidales bacterium]
IDEEQIGFDWTDGLTSWTTPMLEQGTYNLGVQVGYYDGGYICETDTVFVEVNITNDYTCPPVENLTATINSDNTVTLNWDNPVPPSTCSGDLYFEFYLGTVYLGDDDTDDLTTFTTHVLPNGTHTLSVIVNYYNSSGDYICGAEASTTVTITGSFDCPPINDLSATVNPNNTVTLNWTNPLPADYPAGCNGNLSFEFYDGTDYMGDDDTDDLTTFTTPVLSAGNHTLTVVMYYLDDSYTGICVVETSVSVTIENETTCPAITNLTATVNADNTVILNWDNPDPSTWPSTDIDYWFYIDEEQIGFDWTDGLTSWTIPMLEQGTYNLGVQVGYYESYDWICKTDIVFVEVNIANSVTCPSVENLSAIVNSDNTVTLTWDNPVPPSTCSGNLYFEFYLGTVYLGDDGTDDLTTWTTDVLPNGTQNLSVIVYYFNSNDDYICGAEASTTVTISGSFECSPVENLTATINSDNSVTLNWTNPELPSTCSGNRDFAFYLGTVCLGSSGTDDLTTLTTDILPNGTHTLSVIVYYCDDICDAEASTTVTITGSFDCHPVENLTATVNPDNTVSLSWINPLSTDYPAGCNGDIYFVFYDGTDYIGDDDTDDLTSWTTPILTDGNHTLTVVIYYYDDSYNIICFAEASVIVTTDIEEIRSALFSAEIYPNPANDILNIVSDSEIISYELYDAIGRLMLNDSNVSNTESLVNVSSLKHGIYMLRLNTVNGSGMFKIIKN